ncbi:MAG: HAD family phosphatase [Bdellovibrionales bacterium]|nr:HAD family phosphatase [Bdellovibrionales bacterium]
MSEITKTGIQYTAWASVKNDALKGIKGIAFDIDDTFSTEGLISPEAFAALWKLKRAGFALVPITGRPAGWCDHFARFWPIDAIVGENGAFTFYMQDGIRKRLDTPGGDPARAAKIAKLRATLENEFHAVRFASDQAYRENDLAVDFCEDVPAWTRDEVDRLVDVCHREGAHAKVSSIHVNTWYGDFDKRKGFDAWLAAGMPGLGRKFPESFGIPVTSDPPTALAQWIFAGDSPNDEPMFAYFPHSVGVANLANFIDRLKSPPKYLTAKPSGAGFVEMAEKLLKTR